MPKTTKKPSSQTATKSKKPTTHKKTAVKSTKAAKAVQSFRLSREPQPFMTTAPSVQSLYWLIIGVLVLVFVTWAMYLTAQVQAIYDSVMTTETSSYTTTK